VASFLINNMLVDWRVGEAWFWDTLVDADEANNPASWQWVAGSGADAAPYFRVFNPMLQAEKFDPQQEYIKVDTQHILFICGGAFIGLDTMVSRRIGQRHLGFIEDGAEKHRSFASGPGMAVEPEDLMGFGMIPELVGRLPVISTLAELSEDDLVRILVEPNNCMVKQYQKLLAMEDVALTFTESALRELAHIAMGRKMGARGLRAVVESLMLDVMFEAPRSGTGGAIRITKGMVAQKEGAAEAVAKSLKIA